MRHVTEGRAGERWPWLLSRPDRALRCLHGQFVGAMVMFVESVQTPFTVSLLWHFLIFRITTFGDSCRVFSTLGCTLCTGSLTRLSTYCSHRVIWNDRARPRMATHSNGRDNWRKRRMSRPFDLRRKGCKGDYLWEYSKQHSIPRPTTKSTIFSDINDYGIIFSFEQTWTTRTRRAYLWTCTRAAWSWQNRHETFSVRSFCYPSVHDILTDCVRWGILSSHRLVHCGVRCCLRIRALSIILQDHILSMETTVEFSVIK